MPDATAVGSGFAAVAPLLVAWLLSLTVALVYRRVQQQPAADGFFVQALAVAGVVSALIVLSIGDNIARGIGLVGALTVIRFRSTLKNPRDLIFAFAALAVGVAAGAHAYLTAVAGTVVFVAGVAVASRSWVSGAGISGGYDAVFSYRMVGPADVQSRVERELERQCAEHSLAHLRRSGLGGEEHVYHVRLKPGHTKAALFRSLEGIDGVVDTQLVTYVSTPDE